MEENRLAADVVNIAVRLHTRLGPGLFESVYETILAHELEKLGHRVQRQVPIALEYDALCIPSAFRVDLVVNDLLFIEIKSTEAQRAVHMKQLLTYIRLTDRRLGVLLNFGLPRMKEGITRVVNGLQPV